MRVDNRITDGAPMQPLACARCAARVLVRKSSWQQTSVQWNTPAMEACAERDPGARDFEGCGSLRDTIREAALHGAIGIVDRGEDESHPGSEQSSPSHRG